MIFKAFVQSIFLFSSFICIAKHVVLALRTNPLHFCSIRDRLASTTKLRLTSASVGDTHQEYLTRQWDLFRKYQAKGVWRGNWVTYDYMGDVVESTLASVVYDDDADPVSGDAVITQIHEIVTDSTKSDCLTCFDSENVRAFPVAQYTRGGMRKLRLASVSCLFVYLFEL